MTDRTVLAPKKPLTSADLQAALEEFAAENLSDISGGDAASIYEDSISGGEA